MRVILGPAAGLRSGPSVNERGRPPPEGTGQPSLAPCSSPAWPWAPLSGLPGSRPAWRAGRLSRTDAGREAPSLPSAPLACPPVFPLSDFPSFSGA